ADFVTGTAEIRDEILPDGSRATLGPDSALALDFGPRRRRAEILAGMAYFDVVPDSERVFEARAGDLNVTAAEAAFDLGMDAGWRLVSVARGSVQLGAGGTALAQGEELAAGHWLTLKKTG